MYGIANCEKPVRRLPIKQSPIDSGLESTGRSENLPQLNANERTSLFVICPMGNLTFNSCVAYKAPPKKERKNYKGKVKME